MRLMRHFTVVNIMMETVIDCLLQRYHNQVAGSSGDFSLHTMFKHATYEYANREEARIFHPPLDHLRITLPLGKIKIWMNHLDYLLQLLDTNTMIRRRDESGAVPLHHACQNGAPEEVLRMLFRLDDIAGDTAGLVRGEGCAPPRCRDHQGALPIHALLTSKPSVGAVNLLLEAHPPSASMRAMNGDYPLIVACESSASVDVIFQLLKAYPDIVGR